MQVMLWCVPFWKQKSAINSLEIAIHCYLNSSILYLWKEYCTKKWNFPLRIWLHLLKKSLMENFIFGAVQIVAKNILWLVQRCSSSSDWCFSIVSNKAEVFHWLQQDRYFSVGSNKTELFPLVPTRQRFFHWFQQDRGFPLVPTRPRFS